MICQKGAEVFSAPFFVFDFKSEALPKARAARREPQGCLPAGRQAVPAVDAAPRRGARPKTQTEAFKASADDTKTGAAEGSRVRRKRRYGVVWVVHACTLPSYSVSPLDSFIRVSMRVTSSVSALQI